MIFSPCPPPSHKFRNGPYSSIAQGKFVKHMKLYDVIHVGFSVSSRIAESNISNELKNSLMCHFALHMSSFVISFFISLPSIACSEYTIVETLMDGPPFGGTMLGRPRGSCM